MEARELLWLEMMKWHGLKEIVGDEDNPTIVGWFAELGHPEIKDDETAWCSLTVNIMAKRLGLEYSGKLDARSWMKVGKEIKDPQIGDVVVFYRNSMSGWQGHVGLFAGFSEDKKKVFCLGGNQVNAINVYGYPILTPEFGVLGYRRLDYRKI